MEELRRKVPERSSSSKTFPLSEMKEGNAELCAIMKIRRRRPDLLRLLPCTPEDARCERDAPRAAGIQLLLSVLHCPRHASPGSQRTAKSSHNYFQQYPLYLLVTRLLASRTWDSDLPGASK